MFQLVQVEHIPPPDCHPGNKVLGTPISCLVVTVVKIALAACVASRQVRGSDLHALDQYPPELSMKAPQ